MTTSNTASSSEVLYFLIGNLTAYMLYSSYIDLKKQQLKKKLVQTFEISTQTEAEHYFCDVSLKSDTPLPKNYDYKKLFEKLV